MNLIDILLKKGVITSASARKLKSDVSETHESVESLLEKEGVAADKILEIKGGELGIPTKSPLPSAIPFEVLKYLPEESANFYKMIPFAVEDGALQIGIVDPENFEARDALNFISSKDNIPDRA
jgi:type IV pilus assembly protein PilB